MNSMIRCSRGSFSRTQTIVGTSRTSIAAAVISASWSEAMMPVGLSTGNPTISG